MLNLKKVTRKMKDKSVPEMQQIFRQALVEFVLDTRKDVASLVKTRSALAEDLRILDAADPAATASGKSFKLRRKLNLRQEDVDRLFSRQRKVVEHWEHMTEQFAVSLDEVADTLRIPSGSTFRSLFPELFTA